MSDCCCPYIDEDDRRCNRRLRIGRLDEAYALCFRSYTRCAVYHAISEQRAVLTIAGRPRTAARGLSSAVG